MGQRAEPRLYLERAGKALQQARSNFNLEYHDAATSRTQYVMFYAASALLANKGVSRSKQSGVHSAFGRYFIKPDLIEPPSVRMLISAFNVRLDSN